MISFLLFSISQQSIRNKSSLSSYKLGAGKMVKLLRVFVHKHKNLNSIHNTPVKNHVHGHKSSYGEINSTVGVCCSASLAKMVSELTSSSVDPEDVDSHVYHPHPHTHTYDICMYICIQPYIVTY